MDGDVVFIIETVMNHKIALHLRGRRRRCLPDYVTFSLVDHLHVFRTVRSEQLCSKRCLASTSYLCMFRYERDVLR